MKYLDNPILTHLSNSLSDLPTPEYRINVRFEAYSVKPIGKERKMFKEMEEAYVSGQEEMEEMSFSPEMREAGLSSCFGRLDEKESRKVHFLLVSTLNAAFPDHDFSALRPDQFTRERSSAEVLQGVSGVFKGATAQQVAPLIVGQLAMSPPVPYGSQNLHNLHPLGSSLGSSPSQAALAMGNPDLYRILNEVLPLEECEVYSWFPEPEYDPHVDLEDGEDYSDDDIAEEYEEDLADGMDLDVPPSWGQAGMELDDVPSSSEMARRRSSSGLHKRHSISNIPELHGSQLGVGNLDELERRKAGLLWSQNYFFYSKRQKRVLFLTCWCRKRPSPANSPPKDADTTAFPQAISSSLSSPPTMPSSVPTASRAHRTKHQGRNRARLHRKSRPNLRIPAKGDLSQTIPIRGMERQETPSRPTRLATSAPSLSTPSPQAAFARMHAGGFKPRQTPARIMLNAARESNKLEADGTSPGASGDRVRKDRSESSTPGPSLGLVDNLSPSKLGKLDPPASGKRVKV